MIEVFGAALLSGFISIAAAFIAGRYALKAASKTVESTLETLKEQEIRRQQVLAIVQLYGLRGAMTNQPDTETRRLFLIEINKIGALFSTSLDVQKHLKNYHTNTSNANFISLIRASALEAGMDISALSNDDVESIFS